MRLVPLIVKVTYCQENPQFAVENESCIEFQGVKYSFASLSSEPWSSSALSKLYLGSCTLVLVGDSQQAATETLREILCFGSSIQLTYVSSAEVCKNRSFVDVLNPGCGRKFIKKNPLSKLVKRAKLDTQVTDTICNQVSITGLSSLDSPRLRASTVVTVYHGTDILTIIDLAGPEKLNGFCRLNDNTSLETQSHGFLSSFIFDLVPMTNVRYHLHLDQGADLTIIRALLDIFASSTRKNSFPQLSDPARSSSPLPNGPLPGYARPTKSSIAPRNHSSSIYMISKPTLKKQEYSRRKTTISSSHLVERLSLSHRMLQTEKTVTEVKNQHRAALISLKEELANVKTLMVPINSCISEARNNLSSYQQAKNNQDAEQRQNINRLQEEIKRLENEGACSSKLFAEREERSTSQIADLTQKLSTKQAQQKDLTTSLEESQRNLLNLQTQIQDLKAEKVELESKCTELENAERTVLDQLASLKNEKQSEAIVSAEKLRALESENTKLSTMNEELRTSQLIQTKFQQSTTEELEALKHSNAKKLREIAGLLDLKTKYSELENTIANLRKELQDNKEQFQSLPVPLNEQRSLLNANEDVAKIFGYTDVDLASISSTFSPITGFDHLSQIELPNVLKRPISGIASSPNRILRQSNVRLQAPRGAKLASSPARKDARNCEDIENQNC